jgi:hypothetical protein
MSRDHLILVITVEFYRPPGLSKNIRFFHLFFSAIFLRDLIILSQLYLQGTSLSDYRQNVARSQNIFYWFWADSSSVLIL